jgi:catechol 2,3-dioxygenase-like lactoylglutathione lyase family enzyme
MKVPEFTFGHLGLYVTDVEKMVEFYTRVLGFTVSDRGPIRDFELVFLSRNPDEHHSRSRPAARGAPRSPRSTRSPCGWPGSRP